jgi:hypothetical protein
MPTLEDIMDLLALKEPGPKAMAAARSFMETELKPIRGGTKAVIWNPIGRGGRGGGGFDMENRRVSTTNEDGVIRKFAAKLFEGEGGIVCVRTMDPGGRLDHDSHMLVCRYRMYRIRSDQTWRRFSAEEARLVNNWDFKLDRPLKQEDAVVYEGLPGCLDICWNEPISAGRQDPYEHVADYPRDFSEGYGWRHAQHW